MKTNYKFLAALVLGGFMASCAEQDIKEYIVEKPESLTAKEYLSEYGNIKDYIDRAAYPNFRLGCALGATDYSARGIVYRVANSNFDEISLGNAMKYASCVGDDGMLNFGTVTDFLDAVPEGMTVYGHTLAWHAQQNTTWLNSLLADAYVEIGPDDRIVDWEIDFSQCESFPFTVIESCEPKIENGYLTCSSKNNQKYYIAENVPTEEGQNYEIKIMVRSNKETSVSMQFGTGNKISMDVTTDWEEVTIKANAVSDNSFLMIDPGRKTLEMDYQWVSIGHYPPSSRPLTDAEKKENLVNEMNRWVDGMMEACDSRVKSWDMINEAISGGGNVNGYYDLQHAAGGSSSDFFWQDYLGNEDYGPIVSKAARAAYEAHGGNAADLKLFVNDYNLESDWDNNKKVKSLVYWVKVWEENGAKIDGLSSQMHVSYYENKNTMKSKANAYVNMLKIMVNSGKLVRISELDMGYVNKDGDDVKTDDMTEAQHQNMANYYRFIIDMYLKLVPKEQQYGICQWCLTDAPSDSGWRANTPVGLWTLDWNRKTTYAAFCEAFDKPSMDTEDYFEWLAANGLTHYVSAE